MLQNVFKNPSLTNPIEKIPYKIVRSRNYKRLTFSVSPKGFIRISAPHRLSLKTIEQYFHEYADKIMRENQTPLLITDTDITNTSVIEYPFLDDVLKIKTEWVQGEKARRFYHDGVLTFHIPESSVDQRLQIWMALIKQHYKAEARRFFSIRVGEITEKLNTGYEKIRIGDQSSRWGSCSSRKTLSFNMRLLLAPRFVAEYVAVHEAAHLLEGNHSAKFWAIVEDQFPRYKEAKNWLRSNGKSLWKYF